MNYAPIALFTYNRVDKTKTVIESLLLNAESRHSDIFIFSDGPKNIQAVEGVKANREYINSLKIHKQNDLNKTLFKSITIIERERNFGLANNLISGITELTKKYGRVIVVEDDLYLSPYFLKFMNEGLEKYKDINKIGAISSYIYPDMKNLSETFFLKHFHCWGWATWKRSWDLLNTDTKFLLRKMRFKKRTFDVGGAAGAYGNLYCQKVGLVDSWWVRFYASLFLEDKLILYPGRTLTNNFGTDGTGTHSKSPHRLEEMSLSNTPITIKDIEIKESEQCYKELEAHFFNNAPKIGMFSSLYSFLRRLLYIDCL